MKAQILADTFAKQSTVSAKTLPADKIHPLKKGEQYEIIKHSPAPSGHRRITFAQTMGGYQTWLVFDEHVECEGETEILLKVKHYSQRDNNHPQWWRQCNSSTHAMLLNFLKPGSLPNVSNADDKYYREYVEPFGDTTDWTVHTAALEKFGINSDYRMNLDFDDIDCSLELGYPVAIGVYHKGTISNPEGGHVLLIIGKKGDTYIANDPWGNGFLYDEHKGAGVEYPAAPSLERRWLTDGDRTGWGRLITSIDGKPTGL